jgi:hypothetical protein
VLARNDLIYDNFAVATISLENGKVLNLISAYFKYRVSTNSLMQELRKILRACGNSFSKNWFSKRTDNRGQVVEEFIAADNNKSDRLYTF